MKKPLYIVFTDDGTLELRRKLSNAKIICRRILRSQGFTHELKENLEMLERLCDDDINGELCETTNFYSFEIDTGKDDRPGYLYLMRRMV